MPFDHDKVQFNEVDLAAGEALDAVYEAFSGEEFSLQLLAGQLLNIQGVVSYLVGGSREELADRLFDLGVMLKRDNLSFSDLSTDDDTEE